MPTSTLHYRLRIQNAGTVSTPDPTGVALEITSLPGGTNPFIASPPSGDGQELDPITGAVRAGAYTVEVIDARTGTDATGTVRVLTNKLEDATFRQQLLSRRAYIAVSSNGGSTYTNLVAGFITAIRLVSPLRYVITVGDTRRIEQTQPIFRGSALGSFTTRGTLTGGPVTGAFGPLNNRGGWRYQITWPSNGSNDIVTATFIEGYAPYMSSPITRTSAQLFRDDVQQAVQNMGREFVFGVQLATDGIGTVFSDIATFIGTTATNAALTDSATAKGVQVIDESGPFSALNPFQQYTTPRNFVAPYGSQKLYWPASAAVAKPASGSTIWMSMVQRTISELCPLYIDAHPVDIVTAVWAQAGINYDPSTQPSSWITTLKNLIGPDVRLALRMTEAPTIAKFFDEAIFGPFGIGARTNSAGLQELVATRIRTTATPTLTIAVADMRDGSDVVFDYDEQTAVSQISLTQTVLTPAINAPADTSTVPTDGIYANEITGTARYVDLNSEIFYGREVAYKVPGMIRNANAFAPTFTETLSAIAGGMFDRFGRGAPAADVKLLASSAAAAANVGDEVYLEAPHYPNKGYRIGESSVGARIMQVIRRTENPQGPELRLLDSGLAAQPATAPTITIAASVSNPNLIASYTITNAATLNTAANLSVEVEFVIGGATPTTNGQTFTVHAPAAIPTGAVDLPPASASNQTIYVRARTLQQQRRPSNWTAWTSVTLAAVAQPGAITTSNTTATSTQITWTNTSTTLPLAVFAFQGASAPSDWTPYRLSTLPAGSTSTVIRSLTGPSIAWQLALAYDTAATLGPFRTASVTTGTTTNTTKRPAGITAIPTQDDAQLPQGIALGLFPSEQVLDVIIERKSGAGSFAEIARVAGTTDVFVDPRPRDGVTYTYRCAHLLGGFTQTGYTGEVSGTAAGVPQAVTRPGPVAPIVRVEKTQSSTQGTVTLVITDPQGRLVQVRFRNRTNAGAWSSWTVDSTVPYSSAVNLPTSGTLDIEYEVTAFDVDGVERVIAGGIESFIVAAAATKITSFALTFNYYNDPTDPDTFQLDYVISNEPTGATYEFTILQDGVDVGIRPIGTSTSTQSIVSSPIELRPLGSPYVVAVEWTISMRVLDGTNVVATSKIDTGTTYKT